MNFTFSLLLCFFVSLSALQEQELQEIEVGDLVLVMHSKLRQDMPADSARGLPPGEDFEAFVVEISPDRKKVAYERVTATGRRSGTLSMKYVELVKKGRLPRKSRKWTAKSGGTTIEATLTEITNDSVVLKRKNGKAVTVKVDSLSEGDQKYIDRMRDSSLERRAVLDSPTVPFGSKRKSLATKKWNWKAHPVEGQVPTGTYRSVELPMAVSIDRLGMVADDANSGMFGTLGESQLAMASEGQGSRAQGGLGGRRRVGAGRGGRGRGMRNQFGPFHIWESTFSEGGTKLYVLANQVEGQNCAVIVIDLATNEIESSERLDAFALAISTKGERVALLQTGGDEERGELIFRRVGDSEILKRLPVVAPSEIGGGFRVCRGAFMNDSTLITVGNEIVGLDVESGKGYATRQFPLGTMLESFAISPNRKQIAVMSFEGVLLFDAARGKPIGSIAFGDSISGDSCAFSPSGDRLAVFSRSASLISLYDLKTGKLYDSVAVEDTGIDQRISWADERFIMIGEGTLMDLELKTKVWEFTIADGRDSGLTHIRDHWYLYSDAGTNVCPIELPLSEIGRQLEGFDIADAKVLGEGDTFALELDLPFSETEKDEIFKKLRDNLEKRKFVFDESSKNVFVCYVQDGDRESKQIRVGGTLRDPELREASWTTTYSCIDLEVNGEIKWEKRSTNSPNRGNIVRKRNESLEATIQRLASPQPSQFRGGSLPQQFFSFPGGNNILGQSSISLDGLTPR